MNLSAIFRHIRIAFGLFFVALLGPIAQDVYDAAKSSFSLLSYADVESVVTIFVIGFFMSLFLTYIYYFLYVVAKNLSIRLNKDESLYPYMHQYANIVFFLGLSLLMFFTLALNDMKSFTHTKIKIYSDYVFIIFWLAVYHSGGFYVFCSACKIMKDYKFLVSNKSTVIGADE